MKKHPLALACGFLCLCVTIMLASCKKNSNPPAARTIQYILYTKKDFAHDLDTIRFRLFMSSGIHTLFDSSLAPMTIASIPDSLHALVFRKNVPPGYEQAKLAVGFFYAIDNVGESWFIDSSIAGQAFKKVEYNFQ